MPIINDMSNMYANGSTMKLLISFKILDLMLSLPDALLFGNLHIILIISSAETGLQNMIFFFFFFSNNAHILLQVMSCMEYANKYANSTNQNLIKCIVALTCEICWQYF